MDTNRFRQSRGYRALVAVGLASYGIVHLLLAWIALQVAFGHSGNASNQGALRQLAGQPFGTVLLLVMGIGLLTLVVWQGLAAVLGITRAHVSDVSDAKDEIKERGRAAGRALVYLLLAISALSLVAGRSSGGSGDQAEETLTARLLSVPFGRALVVVVGAAVVAVGVSQIVKGVRRKFTEDLRSGISRPVLVLGTAGYTAKGIALSVIGLLFGLAALASDASRAGGMDTALTTIRNQPYGVVLLVIVAAGIACFGLFCFAWARNARR